MKATDKSELFWHGAVAAILLVTIAVMLVAMTTHHAVDVRTQALQQPASVEPCAK